MHPTPPKYWFDRSTQLAFINTHRKARLVSHHKTHCPRPVGKVVPRFVEGLDGEAELVQSLLTVIELISVEILIKRDLGAFFDLDEDQILVEEKVRTVKRIKVFLLSTQ